MFRPIPSVLMIIFFFASAVRAEDVIPENTQHPREQTTGRGRMKTLGGKQFWADVHFFRGYKIQRNQFSGHFRLLDPKSIRITWGKREQCEKRLEEIKVAQKLEPMSGNAVVLVHGLGRSAGAFFRLKSYFTKAGYTVVPFEYPSMNASIETSAEHLADVVDSLDGIEQIDFVAHSLGGLVVRSFLGQRQNKQTKEAITGDNAKPPLHRFVMLGTPNNGAYLATLLKNVPAFQILFGPAGQQLAIDVNGTIAKLPTPHIEFAIIAGGRKNDAGFNPIIPGDDDGTVAVSSTRLEGAADYAIAPVMHPMLLFDTDVIKATQRFLETGKLRESGEAQPLRKNETVRN